MMSRSRVIENLPYLMILVAGATAGIAASALPWGERDLPGLLALTLFGFWLWCKVPSRYRPVLGILLTAYTIRGALAVVLGLWPIMPELYRLDADTYQSWAAEIASGWLKGTAPAIDFGSVSSTVHVYALAVVNALTGGSALAARALMVWLGTMSIHYIYLTGKELVGTKRATIVAWLMAVWPSHAFWTSYPFRDAWVYYFVSRALHEGVQWSRRWRLRFLVRAGVFALLTGVFRQLMGLLLFVALGGIGLWKVLERLRKGRMPLAMSGAIFLIILGALALARVTGLDYRRVLSAEAIAEVRAGLATGGSPINPDLTFSSWGDILRWMPVGAVNFLFTPYPWQAKTAIQWLAVAENGFLYFLIGVGFLQWRNLVTTGRHSALIWMLLLTALAAYGTIEGNVGTAYRHKMQIIPWLLIAFAPGWPLGGRSRALYGRWKGQPYPRQD